MPAVVMQFVSHPRPGSDLATILQLAKDGATLWKKHGADVSYWSVIGGEVGNYAFVARFDSVEAYGRTLAALVQGRDDTRSKRSPPFEERSQGA
ncbi:hypothetical protein ACFLEY_11180 [Bradyrhizobium sp. YCK136]|uniref:hypothetical protein n=1 Tax=Bradyrhizobium sp. YCK136 TaxID=3351346 RepID=UPI0037C5F209